MLENNNKNNYIKKECLNKKTTKENDFFNINNNNSNSNINNNYLSEKEKKKNNNSYEYDNYNNDINLYKSNIKGEDSFFNLYNNNKTQNFYKKSSPHKNFSKFKNIEFDILKNIENFEKNNSIIDIQSKDYSKSMVNRKTKNTINFENNNIINKENNYYENFKYIKTLGNGNFGTIELIENKIDSRQYACKITKITNNTKIDNFNEVKFLSAINKIINSNYVIKYYTSWKNENKIYLLTEYCNKSLQQIINENKNKFIKESEIIKIIKNICKGLKSIHLKNLAHLDIKPENILLGFDNKYKISDLGISTFRNLKKNEEIFEGDSKFMAKEILNKNEDLDLSKADIFSLGISIYYLITRIDLKKNGIYFNKLRNNEFSLDSIKYYSKELKNLIKNMMNSNWRLRPDCSTIINYIKKYNKKGIQLNFNYKRNSL